MNIKSQDKNLVEIQAQWVTVRGRIRQKIGAAQFKSWIKVLSFEDYDDHKVILSVSSNFIRTRIIEQYLDIIKSYWLVENLKINDIQIVVSKNNSGKDSKKNLEHTVKKNESKSFNNDQDVFKSISSLSLNSSTSYKPLPPIIAILLVIIFY